MAETQENVGAVQAVVIPTGTRSLLVPGTAVAEVAGVQVLTPGPTGTALLGTADWHGLRVPVCAFEMLSGGGTVRPQRRSKIVVLYPLPGRARSDFYAILSSADPQSHRVDRKRLSSEGAGSDSPFVQETCLLDGKAVAIPDLQAIRTALDELQQRSSARVPAE